MTTINITEYDTTRARLANLKEKFELTPDTSTPEGYDVVKATVKEGKALKKEIEATRKAVKAPHLERGRQIDAQSDIIKDSIDEMITPWVEAKSDFDAEVTRKREEKKNAEKNRIASIQGCLDLITSQPLKMVGKTSKEIKDCLDTLDATDVENGIYEEFTEDAIVLKQQTQEKVYSMYEDAVEREEQGEAQRIEREALDKEKAEFEEKKKAQDDADNKEREEKEAAEEIEQAEKKALSKVDNLKNYLLEFYDCDNTSDMEDILETFSAIDSDDFDFHPYNNQAAEQIDSIYDKMVKAHIKKVEEETEAKRLREAEQKRLDDEAAEKRIEEEAAEKKTNEANELKKQEEDQERNKSLRHEAYKELCKHVMHSAEAEEILHCLELGEIPHVTVQWNPTSIGKEISC